MNLEKIVQVAEIVNQLCGYINFGYFLEVLEERGNVQKGEEYCSGKGSGIQYTVGVPLHLRN